MILDLHELLDQPGASRPLEGTLDLAGSDLPDAALFSEPVRFSGEVANRSGVVSLDLTVEALLSLTCDRCLEPFSYPVRKQFSHLLARGLAAESDETILVENDRLCLDELVYADILLELPTKLLCRQDCKGLCPVCGANRNETECNCAAG